MRILLNRWYQYIKREKNRLDAAQPLASTASEQHCTRACASSISYQRERFKKLTHIGLLLAGSIYPAFFLSAATLDCFDHCSEQASPPLGSVKVVRYFGAAGGKHPATPVVATEEGYLYGTTTQGGKTEKDHGGTIYRINLANNKYQVLHHFDPPTGTDSYATLVLDSLGNLYGTTVSGGLYNQGVIFRLNTQRMDYEVIHHFRAQTAAPFFETGIMIADNRTLYGTTLSGGDHDRGTIFQYDLTNHIYTTLYSFGQNEGDGHTPAPKPLVLSENGYLYGTTHEGGFYNRGTLFRLHPHTRAYSIIHSFGEAQDGMFPFSGLTRGKDGHFYGTTTNGGHGHQGTIFKLDPQTNIYTLLHAFTGKNGRYPQAGLTAGPNNRLYGVVPQAGWPDNQGAIYSLDPTQLDYTIHHFFKAQEASHPQANLYLGPHHIFYGTSYQGGGSDEGTLFSYSF